jgi:hypothetical protein
MGSGVSFGGMALELRNVSWDAVMKATVRVGKGSGVVIRSGAHALIATAEHVVEGESEQLIRWPGGFDEQAVLARDSKTDVAVLAAPTKLDGVALAVEDIGPEPGDEVIAAGFPDGWDQTHPVLARGVIAGFGTENWVNLDGTWGNSGGPLCFLVGVRPRVVGILLGRAGAASRELDELRKTNQRFLAQLEADREKVLSHERNAIAAAAGGAMTPAAIQWLDRAQTASLQATSVDRLLGLLDDHFRTGFLRFARASEILQLLK